MGEQQKHRHTNFYDPNNPVFDKDHTEERSKQFLALLLILSAIIFVGWWVYQSLS